MFKRLIKSVIILFWFTTNLSAQDFNIFSSELAKNPNQMVLIQSDEFYNFSKNNLPNLDFYFGNARGKEKKSINSTFNEFLIPGDVMLNNDEYYVYEGCRPQSCPEKAFLWVDKKKEIMIGIIVHYYFEEEKSRDGYFLIFSNQIKNAKNLPKEFIQEMKKWNLKATTYDVSSGNMLPIKPSKIRFINSRNKEILDITNLNLLK